ncbi:hypothetical protein ARMGADRAFT_1034357 [Armillaria gallica]|uniref:Uncharacterized protein n=1 Tax=Armillaria gallica TaxID=47427 RepID=A0A2H3D1W9_ARMGA|nr:hypothetical protein ARMGADRAFT_1034357 [Armillaria gallica]
MLNQWRERTKGYFRSFSSRQSLTVQTAMLSVLSLFLGSLGIWYLPSARILATIGSRYRPGESSVLELQASLRDVLQMSMQLGPISMEARIITQSLVLNNQGASELEAIKCANPSNRVLITRRKQRKGDRKWCWLATVTLSRALEVQCRDKTSGVREENASKSRSLTFLR